MPTDQLVGFLVFDRGRDVVAGQFRVVFDVLAIPRTVALNECVTARYRSIRRVQRPAVFAV
ncbi:hypothetical protein [Haloarcula amylolytica]|uniref:hypothetical protein n=1 Tax=Haloarcula amylolytica TaxID=396317 RepID=UPI003C77A266